MRILIRTIALSLALCATVMAQDPIMKRPLVDQDLRDNPMLTPRQLPVPAVPDMSRLGVAGNPMPLSLKEAIRMALENNNDIEVTRDNVRLAETTLQSLEGVYDPIINLAPQYEYSRTPSVNVSGGSTPSGIITQKIFSLSSSLTKQFSKGGGQYQFFFNTLRGTSNAAITQLSPFYNINLGVTFTQPLLRDRSIDRFRHDIRVQRKRLTQSDYDFRLQVIAVIAQVQQAYWELVFALRDQQNQLSNLNLAREQLRMIEDRIAAAISSPLERAQALTQISTAETNLFSAIQFVTTTENALKQLILHSPAAGEWTARIEPTDQPSIDTTPVNLDGLLTEAFANRPELNRLHLQQEINDIDVKFFRNQTLPRLDLQSTVLSTGFAGSPLQTILIPGTPTATASAFLLDQINQLRFALGLPKAAVPQFAQSLIADKLVGGYGQALSNLSVYRTITVSVGIQFPLRNRTAEANLAGARIQGEQLLATLKSQEQAIEVDVRNAAQSVEIVRRQVLSARAASESAEIQLAGELKRYQTGLSTTFLIFQYENQLVSARTAELRAEANYNQALANLQRATSSTLRVNNIIVEPKK